METKKISFGFNKTAKKTEIVSKAPKPNKQVELIECLEDQSIKIKDAVEESNQPLIIPIHGSSNKLLDEIKKAKEKRLKNEIKEESIPDSALSIDELAARELIREAKNRDAVKTESKVFLLPLTDEKFVAEGGDESTLEDYENVPISDYGMAMLRGMNWKEGMPIGKRTKQFEVPKLPELRPKGLGLGANKMVNSSKPSQAVDKNGKELQLVKGALCKIIAGAHRGHYCEVQGLDDENSRIIVKKAPTNEVLTLNEFLIAVVTKEEYDKGCRVINNVKYEEYQAQRERSRSPNKQESSGSKKKKKKLKKSKHKSHSSDSEEGRRRRKKKNKKSDEEREHRKKRDKDTKR